MKDDFITLEMKSSSAALTGDHVLLIAAQPTRKPDCMYGAKPRMLRVPLADVTAEQTADEDREMWLKAPGENLAGGF